MGQTTDPSVSIVSSNLDAFKRLRLPRRPRAQAYSTIDGLNADRDAVPWFWRLLAVASSFMILGGFLMLPTTFDHDPKLRLNKTAVGIFGVAILATGLSFTALLTFAVRNPLFQADGIFLPSLLSCAVGLLTVLYDFLLSSRYVWATPALLVVIAAALSTVTYAGLLIWTHRRISVVRARGSDLNAVPLRENSISGSNLYQNPSYYKNYIRNMFPTSAHPAPVQETSFSGNASSLTEEEMQRQQMLMLLLARDQPSTPNPSEGTFRIDWQGQDQDDGAPAHGYYAPNQTNSSVSLLPTSSISRYTTNQELRPWDGVMRGVTPTSAMSITPDRGRVPTENSHAEATGYNPREERRRQIESGR